MYVNMLLKTTLALSIFTGIIGAIFLFSLLKTPKTTSKMIVSPTPTQTITPTKSPSQTKPSF
ncbi:MAG TPA: hypothetical protein VF810_00985 [Patescibacteria group bacterium]